MIDGFGIALLLKAIEREAIEREADARRRLDKVLVHHVLNAHPGRCGGGLCDFVALSYSKIESITAGVSGLEVQAACAGSDRIIAFDEAQKARWVFRCRAFLNASFSNDAFV